MRCKRLGAGQGTVLLALFASSTGFTYAASAPAQPWLGSTVAVTPDAPVVHLMPILGSQSPASPGWLAFLVRIENPASSTLKGQVTLHSARGQRSVPSAEAALASASVALGRGETTSFQLAVYGADSAELTLSLVDERGRLVSQANTLLGPVNQLHLFDLDAKSLIVPALNHQAVARRIQDPTARESLTASEASRDPSDRRLLPEHVAEYSAATLVLCASVSLETLPESDWKTLGGWILAGGSLAVSPDATTTTTERLQRLVGGPVERSAWSERMFDLQPRDWLSAGRPRAALEEPRALTPLSESAIRELTGVRGGNLRPSAWGAVASYGLGEVHVLGFNPNSAELSSTDWTLEKLQTLARHAKQRRRSIALPLGIQHPDDSRTFAVRQVLCNLGGASTALIAAALVLFAYAALVGPINFRHSKAARTPLAPLSRLAGLSVVTFCVVFGVSYFSYGGRPRARHLSLIEAGAAMPRAAITRFRAFYDDSYATKRFATLETSGNLALVNSERDARATTRSGSSGMFIERVVSEPWKTLLLREEGLVDLGRGIDLALDGDALAVHNRSDRDLTGVVIRTVDGRTFFYDGIPAGERILTSDSHVVQVTGAPATSVYFPLLIANFDWRLDQLAPGLTAAWQALEALRPGEVDWWPPDVPVLLAQLRGGEGRAVDTDYPLESDRVLVRVIGYGSGS